MSTSIEVCVGGEGKENLSVPRYCACENMIKYFRYMLDFELNLVF